MKEKGKWMVPVYFKTRKAARKFAAVYRQARKELKAEFIQESPCAS